MSPLLRRARLGCETNVTPLLLAGLAVLCAPHAAIAQNCPNPVALFQSVRNNVQVVPVATKTASAAASQTPVCAGDTIRVGDGSRAVIVMLASNTPLAIDQNTVFIVTEPDDRSRTLIELLQGALLYISRLRRQVEIRTPFVNASIEGTEFVIRVQEDRSHVTVQEGAVRASNDLGMVLVGPGQQAVAQRRYVAAHQPAERICVARLNAS